MNSNHSLAIAFLAMCLGVVLGRGFGLWVWSTRRPADTDPPGSLAEKLLAVVSVIPVAALLFFVAILLRGWIDQGYFPRNPFLDGNNLRPTRGEPEGRYGLHWGTTFGLLIASLLSIVVYPGIITYLLSCRRPRYIGLAGPYVLGYVAVVILMVQDPGGLFTWFMD